MDAIQFVIHIDIRALNFRSLSSLDVLRVQHADYGRSFSSHRPVRHLVSHVLTALYGDRFRHRHPDGSTSRGNG